MSSEPAAVTIAELEELERLWREQSAPIAAHLKPGLTADEIDRRTNPIGIAPPPEAHALWGWHDPGIEECEVDGSRWSLLPLDAAIQETVLMREILQDVDRSDPDTEGPSWPVTWLVFASSVGGTVAVIDCGVPDAHGCSKIFVYDTEMHEDDPTPAAASLGEVIGWWIETLAMGSERYDIGTGEWISDEAAYPPGRIAAGLG